MIEAKQANDEAARGSGAARASKIGFCLATTSDLRLGLPGFSGLRGSRPPKHESTDPAADGQVWGENR
ncbi:MAG: hypothetical protein Ct9H300mP8_02260 [Gammaproteobacteria bacterium]|nr:MAG: hypothetical protein Ct9H300mP8_02260 [Gammaproteobacteria bacterium]